MESRTREDASKQSWLDLRGNKMLLTKHGDIVHPWIEELRDEETMYTYAADVIERTMEKAEETIRHGRDPESHASQAALREVHKSRPAILRLRQLAAEAKKRGRTRRHPA